MSLPNPSMSFTPFDPLTASEMNDIVENVEALSDGSGLEDGAITAPKIDFGGAGSGVWWEEIGRTTLGVAGDTIDITTVPVRKYLRIVISALATGGTTDIVLRFNADSGSNYSRRTSVNGGADATATGVTSMVGITASAANKFGELNVLNFSGQQKLAFVNVLETGNPPGRLVTVSRWDNTAQITRITLTNGGTGDFAAGSEVVVLGHD